MQAIWDLKTNPTTWDFCVFLVCVKTLGVEGVRFRYEGKIQNKKYGEEIAWHRYKNILVPLCELSKTPYELGPGGEGITHGYHMADLNKVYREHGRIFKFQPTYRKVNGSYVTFTIRQSFRNIERNSNRPEWEKFAEHLRGKKVIFLEDREEDPIPVAERMSLYAYAEMNYGVNNGPMALLYASDCPYTVFNMVPKENAAMWRDHMTNGGFPEGSQLDFRNEQQRIVWESDDFDNMKRLA